jgi:hypothetical protein
LKTWKLEFVSKNVTLEKRFCFRNAELTLARAPLNEQCKLRFKRVCCNAVYKAICKIKKQCVSFSRENVPNVFKFRVETKRISLVQKYCSPFGVVLRCDQKCGKHRALIRRRQCTGSDVVASQWDGEVEQWIIITICYYIIVQSVKLSFSMHTRTRT